MLDPSNVYIGFQSTMLGSLDTTNRVWHLFYKVLITTLNKQKQKELKHITHCSLFITFVKILIRGSKKENWDLLGSCGEITKLIETDWERPCSHYYSEFISSDTKKFISWCQNSGSHLRSQILANMFIIETVSLLSVVTDVPPPNNHFSKHKETNALY